MSGRSVTQAHDAQKKKAVSLSAFASDATVRAGMAKLSRMPS